MKRLAILFGLLLAPTVLIAVVEGPPECLLGTGCTAGGGKTFRVGIRGTGTFTVGNYDNGTYCFSIDPAPAAGVNPVTCTNQVDAVRSGGGMVTQATIVDTCYVSFADDTGWAAGDLMEVQVVEIADGGGGSAATVGDKFTFMAPADDCAGAANCASALGIYKWDVNGITSGAAATLGVRIEDSAGDPDVDNSARMTVAFNCSY